MFIYFKFKTIMCNRVFLSICFNYCRTVTVGQLWIVEPERANDTDVKENIIKKR